MRLHVHEHGAGPRVVVLLHGMMGSGESWWRIAPLLAERGYRVLALDLPGHGESPRDPELDMERTTRAVRDAVAARTQQPPAVAMGHSFGGQVLAAAMRAGRLDADLAVFVDSPFSTRGGWDRADAQVEYEQSRRRRTLDALRRTRPHYSERDCVVEARAAERFDPQTIASLASQPGESWQPRAGSIVVRADPSDDVDDALAARLRDAGLHVRSIRGAAHSVWYSHFDAFVAALPEVFDA